MSDVTESPGARLKRERERQGISLQKAADELRLDPSVIEALEADQFDKVGPAVYARGHLKKFALLLAIPQQEILDGYAALQTSPVAAAPQPTNLGLGAPGRVRFEKPPLPPLPLAAAALGIVMVIVLFWWSPWKSHLATTAASTPMPESAQGGTADVEPASAGPVGADGDEVSRPAFGAAEPAGPQAAGSAPAAMPPATAAAAPAAAATPLAPAAGGPVPGAGRARLRMSFSADSWVDVRDASGRRVFVGNGRANSVKTIAGEAPLHVYLGYASGVQLEINEHAVAIARPFLSGDVARFEAGADGVLRQSAGGARPRG
jgi:cytoskeleton protein RodZ